MSFLFAAIALGFLGSFHCVGMCGPIALALPVHDRSLFFRILFILLYNAGRMFTYAVFGLLFGTIGKGFFLAGYQQGLSIAIGLLMLISVLLPSKYNTQQKWNASIFGFFNGIKQSLSKLFLKKKSGSMFLIGLLNGLLPCALVYVAVSGAVATGDPLKGAVFMALFGFGTLPMMFLLPFAGHYASIPVRNKIRKTIPVMVGLMAVLLILRGSNLGIPYLSPQMNEGGTITCHTTTNGTKKIIKCTSPLHTAQKQ